MDADANDSQKATPISKIICSDKSDLTTGKERAADIASDEEDEEPSPSRSKKSSSTRSVNKRTSPVRIYTYKVISWILLPFHLCLHGGLGKNLNFRIFKIIRKYGYYITIF